MRHSTTYALWTTLGLLASAASGQPAVSPPSPEAQIAAAVSPAPEEMRAGAAVLGYAGDSSKLVSLREGEGDLVCLADNPYEERFHVACYFKELEPFMLRGRQLRDEGLARDEVRRIREEEIESGKLDMPRQPTALYSHTGPAGSYDPETGAITGVNHVHVVYIPYATAATTGLTDKPAVGTPWLMSPGTPWAHIMLVQPPPEEKDGGKER